LVARKWIQFVTNEEAEGRPKIFACLSTGFRSGKKDAPRVKKRGRDMISHVRGNSFRVTCASFSDNLES
jgi:hypothetical protein